MILRNRYAVALVTALGPLIVIATGCAMLVTGIVRDASTGIPIGGAVLTASDGRNRLSTSDPNGRYAVKTDWEPSTLLVSAPSYVTTSIAVPGSQRFPVVNVDLDRAFAVAGWPDVGLTPHGGRVSAGSGVDAGMATKLRQLQELYDRGTISNEEYRGTRKRILEQP